MIPNETVSQSQKREDYLTQIRTARSKRPRMTSAEFYSQMERSMGTKTGWTSSVGSSKSLR